MFKVTYKAVNPIFFLMPDLAIFWLFLRAIHGIRIL